MNESILELWKETSIIHLSDIDYLYVLKFSKYMDKNSLWLVKYTEETHSFLFSNDGQRLEFSLNEIRDHIQNMDKGKSFPWEIFKDV